MSAHTASPFPSPHAGVQVGVQPSSHTAIALPQLRTLQTLHALRRLFERLTQTISRTGGLRFQPKPRRLKLQETIQLGDKRFIAILRVDGDEFLLGGGSTGVSILGQLHPDPNPVPAAATTFAAVLAGHRKQSQQEDPA